MLITNRIYTKGAFMDTLDLDVRNILTGENMDQDIALLISYIWKLEKENSDWEILKFHFADLTDHFLKKWQGCPTSLWDYATALVYTKAKDKNQTQLEIADINDTVVELSQQAYGWKLNDKK